MTFASVLELEEAPLSKVHPATAKGLWIKLHYSFSQLATDGGGTINVGSGTIKKVIATGNVLDKPLSATWSGTTITIAANATAGPTAGWVEVLVLRK